MHVFVLGTLVRIYASQTKGYNFTRLFLVGSSKSRAQYCHCLLIHKFVFVCCETCTEERNSCTYDKIYNGLSGFSS